MREALYDRFLDDIACVDFRGGGEGGRAGRAGSKASEAKRFLTSLRRTAELQGRYVFSTSELHSMANDISLRVKDVATFIAALNEDGELLKAGPGMYRMRGVNPTASQSQAGPAMSQGGPAFGSQQTLPVTQRRHVLDTPVSALGGNRPAPDDRDGTFRAKRSLLQFQGQQAPKGANGRDWLDTWDTDSQHNNGSTGETGLG